LIAAAREMRNEFGEQAKDQLAEVLRIVTATANELGVPVGKEAKALLDAHSVSISGGTISLHDARGVPLKALGLGSARLLIAGLQRQGAQNSSMVIVDELEHGLEPHRIIRLIDALGAKEQDPPLQAFITTHSPAAVRELSGNQLYVVRKLGDEHFAKSVGTANDIQGTIRKFPEALLAPSIIVCEGASEVGLLRGLDQHRIAEGETALTALGVGLVDGGGNNTFRRANAFRLLGYRTAVLRDSDTMMPPLSKTTFRNHGGTVFAWMQGRALEDELFLSLSNDAVGALVNEAIRLKDESFINENIKSASSNAKDLAAIRTELRGGGITDGSREVLAAAAKSGTGWFKTVTAMETVAREIIGPALAEATDEFSEKIETIFDWMRDDQG
jgi:putative ATP-dependent endonuclease of OLD family